MGIFNSRRGRRIPPGDPLESYDSLEFGLEGASTPSTDKVFSTTREVTKNLKRVFSPSTPTWEKLFIGYSIGSWAYSSYKSLKGKYNSFTNKTISLFFEMGSEPFDALAAWIQDTEPVQMVHEKSFDIKCNHNHSNINSLFGVPEAPVSSAQNFFIKRPSYNAQFNYKNIVIQVELVEPVAAKQKPIRGFKVALYTKDEAIVDSFLYDIAYNHLNSTKKEVNYVYNYSSWGGWVQNKPVRDVTVVLPGTQLEDLVADVKQFLTSESFYTSWGLPYKRGYMLYGLPRSGKTSTIQKIANEIQYGICFINLSQLTESTDIGGAISDAPKNCIIVIEDFDSALLDIEGEKKETSNKAFSLDSLLNCLDGFNTTYGQIIFITANDISKIPEKLHMPGRIDYKLGFNPVVEEQVRIYGAIQNVLPTAIDNAVDMFVKDKQSSFAEVQQYFLSTIDRSVKSS